MIKYIILIICITILIYLLFKYKREGFDTLQTNITILDISQNLLIDNCYNFIDGSLNVIHSNRYYPKDLFDINDIVDDIVTDDISYNISKVNLRNASEQMDNSRIQINEVVNHLNTKIDFFDNDMRNTINNRIRTTNLDYEWSPSTTTTNIINKYNSFKEQYDNLISLRDNTIINPPFNRNDNTYYVNKTISENEWSLSFNTLKGIRENLSRNGYNISSIEDTNTDNDILLLNSLLAINADTNLSIDSSFNTKYNLALNPPGPNIQKITFNMNTLNLPDISNSITNQHVYINSILLRSYNNDFKTHIDNLNNYVTIFVRNLELINGYNDLDMLTKITDINFNCEAYYNSNELLNTFNLNTFKITYDNGSINPSTVVNSYKDISLNNVIEYSLNTSYNSVVNPELYRDMANKLYNMRLSNIDDYNTLYRTILADYITNETYIKTIHGYIDAINTDIMNSNSLISSINYVMSLSCNNRLLHTNPISKYLSKSSTDIINGYINNSAIRNLSYYGTYSQTNTNINCDSEIENQPILDLSNNNNINLLVTYLNNINIAIYFYNKYRKYINIKTEYEKYIIIKPRLDSMLKVVYAYNAFMTNDSYGNVYRELISSYSKIVETKQYYDIYYRPCIIKRYATNIYNSSINDYNTKYTTLVNATKLYNIKSVFDYIYSNFEIGLYSVIKDYYDEYVILDTKYINDTNNYQVKLNEYNVSLNKIKTQNNVLHNRISNTVQGIVNDTNGHNRMIIEQTIENKTNEMINNLNSYTLSVNQSKKNAVEYMENSNRLLEKQQIAFGGGNGPDAQLNDYLNGMNSPFVSSDVIRSGVINRYKDTECGENEFIYCLGGKIDCVDIYGDVIQDSSMEDMSSLFPNYKRGKTYGKCGSHINKINISEYSNNLNENLTQQGNIGYFYDLTKCTPDKPWRVGGEGTPIEFNNCYANQDRASGMFSILRNMNPSDFTNKVLVYIEGDYILQDYAVRFPETITILNNTTAKWFGNQKMYQGIIKSMNRNNLFDIYVPDENGTLLIDVEPQHLRLPNISLKNPNNLDNLPKGSYPRPICRYGKFSDKCSKGDDPPIDFKSKNVASNELELNKYLITPKYDDSKYITGSNTLSDLYTSGTNIANTNNVLGFSLFE